MMNILCLSKDDWDTRCGRKQQLMYAMAKKLPASKIAYAMPPRVSFRFRDAFMADKTDWPAFLEPPDNLALFSSFRPPLDRFSIIRNYGRKARLSSLLKATESFFNKNQPDILWAYEPWDYILFENKKPPWIKIFDFTEDWSKFKPETLRNAAALQKAQRKIIQNADIVFAVTEALCRTAEQFNDNVHLLPNATNPDHFNPENWKNIPFPEECRNLKRPVLGWTGHMGSYFDVETVHYLADTFPNATILLIGGCSTEAESLKHHANVKLLGHRSHADIPNYIRCFDVCIAPYKRDITGSPTKIYEYIAAGKPVVAIVAKAIAGETYNFIRPARTKEEFAEQVSSALANTGNTIDKNMQERFLSQNSWTARVKQILTTQIHNDTKTRICEAFPDKAQANAMNQP